jgi:hypothetical protein
MLVCVLQLEITSPRTTDSGIDTSSMPATTRME